MSTSPISLAKRPESAHVPLIPSPSPSRRVRNGALFTFRQSLSRNTFALPQNPRGQDRPPSVRRKSCPGVNLFISGRHHCACSFTLLSHPQGQAKLSQPALLINRLSGRIRVRRPFGGSPIAFPSNCIRGIHRILIQKRGSRPSPSPPVQAPVCVTLCHYPGCPRYHPRGSNPTTAWEFPSPSHPSRAPDRNSRPKSAGCVGLSFATEIRPFMSARSRFLPSCVATFALRFLPAAPIVGNRLFKAASHSFFPFFFPQRPS